MLALVIGWLRKTIDELIEREAEGKRRLEAIVRQLPVAVQVVNAQGEAELIHAFATKLFGEKLKHGILMLHDCELAS